MIRGVYMAWNVFKWCKGLKALGSLMIFAVLAIVAVTYYSVVVLIYGPQLLRGHALLAAILILLAFHALAVFTNPGKVPENWRPIIDEEENEAHPDSLSATPSLNGASSSIADRTTENGSTRLPNVRYCRKCSHFKPPRSHHCSVCGRCVLKMDHHCVWITNCVGAYNYKFFLLFLLYTFLETTLCTFVLLPHFIAFFRGIGNERESAAYLATTFLAFVLNVAFMLSLLGFLILHTTLVFSNTTTIEVHEKKSTPRWRYDLGARENFEQVFGKSKLCWLIPVYSERDKQSMHVLQGLEYPERPDNEEHCCECRNRLAYHHDLASKGFQGKTGRAFLFWKVANISVGKQVDRELRTGLHTVADISCHTCKQVLGWMYVKAYRETERYKEGKYILERAKLYQEE